MNDFASNLNLKVTLKFVLKTRLNMLHIIILLINENIPSQEVSLKVIQFSVLPLTT